MTSFQDQIQRIKEKLPLAKAADPNLKVFGAIEHKYEMHAPATVEQVQALEERLGVPLPECYKAFILEVGNGGDAYLDEAAGPHYGIYPLGGRIETFVEIAYLKNDCIIYPGMTKEYWQSVMARMEADEVPDEEYEMEIGRIFGGILPIGNQGCSLLHGIILNGPHKGVVVNLSEDKYQPIFTFEKNFLDWYERWLDEVIGGELGYQGAGSFGYHMGGPDTALIQQFLHANDMQEKKDCLKGLQWKKQLSPTTIDLVENEYFNGSSAFTEQHLRILTKHAYEKAKPILAQLAPVDIGRVCSLVHYHAATHKAEWVPFVIQYIHTVRTEDDFRFCTYILPEAGYGDLLVPFIEREDARIRQQVLYYLRRQKDKERHLDIFIKSLYDADDWVVIEALRALEKVPDNRLPAHYKKVAERPASKAHVHVMKNLEDCLRHFGYTIKDVQ